MKLWGNLTVFWESRTALLSKPWSQLRAICMFDSYEITSSSPHSSFIYGYWVAYTCLLPNRAVFLSVSKRQPVFLVDPNGLRSTAGSNVELNSNLDWPIPSSLKCLASKSLPNVLSKNRLPKVTRIWKTVMCLQAGLKMTIRTWDIFWETKLWRFSDDLKVYKTSWIGKNKKQNTKWVYLENVQCSQICFY